MKQLLMSNGANSKYVIRKRSGSVVECLTPDREDAGSSLTGVKSNNIKHTKYVIAIGPNKI